MNLIKYIKYNILVRVFISFYKFLIKIFNFLIFYRTSIDF